MDVSQNIDPKLVKKFEDLRQDYNQKRVELRQEYQTKFDEVIADMQRDINK